MQNGDFLEKDDIFVRLNGGDLVNLGSGELAKLKPELTEAQLKAIERKRQQANNNFVNNIMDSMEHVMEKLTRPQRGLLLILLCYLDYYEKGGKIVYINRCSKPLTRKDMQHVLKCSKQTLSDFIKACEDGNIMHYNETEKAYVVNSEIAFKGGYRDMGKNVVSMVTHTLKDALNELKPAQIGLIYDLQKFVNAETLFLCENPNEKDTDKLRVFNQKQLAEALGVSEVYMKKNLQNIVIRNQYIVAKVVNGKEVKMMINPNFIFRGGHYKALDIAKPFEVLFSSRKTW